MTVRCSGMMVVAVMMLATMVSAATNPPLARFKGSDFAGGGAPLFGSTQHDTPNVNYVYAEPTGERSRITASFNIKQVPAEPQYVHVQGMDDDFDAVCPIEIRLNGTTLFTGPSGFPNGKWELKHYRIPDGVLKAGSNSLVIANRSKTGVLGMPPWFMVALAAVAGEKYDPNGPLPFEEDFRVDLPSELRPLPEPLPPEHKEPGFKIRGTKGWMWTPEQYLAEIPTLKRYKLNFMMNCYTSLFDMENRAWGDPDTNRWWEPLPDKKKQGFERVARACQEAGIDFCFSMNPNLVSRRFVSAKSPADVDALFQHYAWMQGLGVKWFNVSLDDITAGIDAADQASVVNEMCRRLRARDPHARMIFCPTYYWGRGEEPKAAAYLSKLADVLDKDVYVFWTGVGVEGRITRADAEAYRARVRHRIVVWDNYPVTNFSPTMHLGPVVGRDADLCEVVEGIMSNPHRLQNEANRIPLLTFADYAWNPWQYDPARSIGQAIVHLAETPAQRAVLKDLVELYYGFLLEGKNADYNPVQTRFNEIVARPHSRYLAEIYLRHVEDVARRLAKAFPNRFHDAGKTMEESIATMKAAYRTRYGE